MAQCHDHLEFIDEKCPDCKLQVDENGNTEDQFDYCSFPCCGCDHNRNCMAKNGPNGISCSFNINKEDF